MMHFALQSNRVIVDGAITPACIEIQDEKIIAIHPYGQKLDCTVEDYQDHVLMPGLVDSHVHINEPGRTEWEGFNTATQAAAAGGITTVVDMPLNCIPVTTTKQAFQEKLDCVADKLWVDCGFWGGVIPDNIDQLDELLCSGVLGVKSFLIDSGVEEFPNVTIDDIRKALPILSKHQVPYLIHAELEPIVSDKNKIDTDPNLNIDSSKSYQAFLNSRPKQWENDAVDLMINLARESKENDQPVKVHIVHLSSDEALSKISRAKTEGLDFTAETCPHYLTLAAEMIPDSKTLFKCCPPIREEANREHLWQAIKSGIISFIVSDHSPCTPQLKEIDSGDIEKAWGGISALQFGLPLIWTEAKSRGFTLPEISSLMSEQTAKFAGLDHIKGTIKIGNDADIIVFDDQSSFVINNEMIKHKHKITPYVGTKVTGIIRQTFVRGNSVFSDNKFNTSAIGKPLLKQN